MLQLSRHVNKFLIAYVIQFKGVNGKLGNGKLGNRKIWQPFFGGIGKVGNGKLGNGNPEWKTRHCVLR